MLETHTTIFPGESPAAATENDINNNQVLGAHLSLLMKFITIIPVQMQMRGSKSQVLREQILPAGLWHHTMGMGDCYIPPQPSVAYLDQQNGYGTLFFAIAGLQNGAPDGIALVKPDNSVVLFLSYEGSFTATDGPAIGLTSTDIGVLEAGTEALGLSLQLSAVRNVS